MFVCREEKYVKEITKEQGEWGTEKDFCCSIGKLKFNALIRYQVGHSRI